MGVSKYATVLRRAAFAVALVSAASAQPAVAQLGTWQQKLAPTLDSQEQFKFVAASGVVSTFSNPAVYLGPYSATLTSDPTKSTFSIFCVDFLNSINVGTVWTANISSIAEGALANTRLGLAGVTDAVVRYQKAIWLATQFATNQTRVSWSGIHDAIWATVTPGDGIFRTTDGSGKYWFDQVNTAFANGAPANLNYSEWRIVTDVNAAGRTGGVQEQLLRVSAAPEPETYLLMVTGLIAMFVMYRTRRRPLPW